MAKTLTAPQCLEYFFRTRKKFNTRVLDLMEQIKNAHHNFLGYRVSYCQLLLPLLPERIAMTEFLMEHFHTIPETEPIMYEYLNVDHDALVEHQTKAGEYLRHPDVY